MWPYMWISDEFAEIYSVDLKDVQSFEAPTTTALPIRGTIPCLNQYLDLGEREEE